MTSIKEDKGSEENANTISRTDIFGIYSFKEERRSISSP
jgi:hypothetical protein